MRLAALILLAILVSSPSLADITGRPKIIDGDTIRISQQRIRLFGIDAPEGSQYCKERQALALRPAGENRPRRVHWQGMGALHQEGPGPLQADRGRVLPGEEGHQCLDGPERVGS